MGNVSYYDTAIRESFNATLECELRVRNSFNIRREASLAIFDFIEGWYNLHPRIPCSVTLSPINYERKLNAAA